MFEHWGEFYLLAGSAAAVLIGLIFVVVTLMQDKPRSTMLAGAQLYMGPVVLQVSFVLVLSAAALTPGIGPRDYAVISAIVAAWGLFRGHPQAPLAGRSAALDRPMVLRRLPDPLVAGRGRSGLGILDQRALGGPRRCIPGHCQLAVGNPQRVGPDHLACTAARLNGRRFGRNEGRALRAFLQLIPYDCLMTAMGGKLPLA